MLGYLSSAGAKLGNIERIILRLPQIPEYTVDNTLKFHVVFLVGLNIPDSKIKRVIAAAPSLFSCSVENSLKPTMRQLVKKDGNVKNDFGMWTIKVWSSPLVALLGFEPQYILSGHWCRTSFISADYRAVKGACKWSTHG